MDGTRVNRNDDDAVPFGGAAWVPTAPLQHGCKGPVRAATLLCPLRPTATLGRGPPLRAWDRGAPTTPIAPAHLLARTPPDGVAATKDRNCGRRSALGTVVPLGAPMTPVAPPHLLAGTPPEGVAPTKDRKRGAVGEGSGRMARPIACKPGPRADNKNSFQNSTRPASVRRPQWAPREHEPTRGSMPTIELSALRCLTSAACPRMTSHRLTVRGRGATRERRHERTIKRASPRCRALRSCAASCQPEMEYHQPIRSLPKYEVWPSGDVRRRWSVDISRRFSPTFSRD